MRIDTGWAALDAFGIGCQVDSEGAGIFFQIQIRGRVVEYAGLMEIDIQAAVGLQLQGGLDAPV